MIFDTIVIVFLASYYFNFQTFGVSYFSLEFLLSKATVFSLYSSILWLLAAYSINFYAVFRYTSSLNILGLLVKQFFLFFIIIFAYAGFYGALALETDVILKYLITSISIIGVVKFFTFYALKTFRRYLNGNLRSVLIIGNTEGAKDLARFFTNKKEYGYNLLGVYGDTASKGFGGTVDDALNYLSKNEAIDEIYCAMEELSQTQINTFVKYAELKRCNIKFIPETTTLLSKHLKTDFYNYLPVLSIQEVTLNQPVNRVIKRGFDIVFSIGVIVFLLSWLSIILYILVKLESKGPLFYKHKRNGINYKEFDCYKYRSLSVHSSKAEDYVTKADTRVTKIGRFLRRTSIDELPQFYNVLRGDMSVVGPRPHMIAYTDAYSKKIDKYNFILRHNVKPGITGLAQTKGYRGEIKKDGDIINRVKFDIFYIENWSLLLDLKIIGNTIINLFKGDENAY
jgi:putative colanic acid biosynthesis UDP-glucose lipid carrier transferase